MNSLILFLVGITVVYLYLIGDLVYYIYPGYNLLSLVTGVIFILVGFYLFSLNIVFKKCNQYNCKHSKIPNLNLLQFAIIIPICIGLFIQAKPLSIETALTRGTSLSLVDNEISTFDIFVTNPENRTLIDWVRVLTANPEPDTYLDQKVNITGFLIYPPDFPNEVYISQFIISCCAADARPISLSVEKNSLFDAIAEGTWVQLEGNFSILDLDYERRAIIKPIKITPITPPLNPYEYQ